MHHIGLPKNDQRKGEAADKVPQHNHYQSITFTDWMPLINVNTDTSIEISHWKDVQKQKRMITSQYTSIIYGHKKTKNERTNWDTKEYRQNN